MQGGRFSEPNKAGVKVEERQRASTFLTAKAEIQGALGSLGRVLTFTKQIRRDRGVIAEGWYAELYFEDPACECDRCRATRAGRPALLAGRRIEAIEEVAVYKHTHPTLLMRAQEAGEEE